MNRRRIVYPLLVAGLALGVGWFEGRWHSDRTVAGRKAPAKPSRPAGPPTGVEVPMTIGPAPALPPAMEDPALPGAPLAPKLPDGPRPLPPIGPPRGVEPDVPPPGR